MTERLEEDLNEIDWDCLVLIVVAGTLHARVHVVSPNSEGCFLRDNIQVLTRQF
jgi:hypothetical protein